jgi:hypothetical protein
MQVYDVYKERKHTVIKLGERDFKIPNEYTVEEVERLLELEQKRDALEKEEVTPETEKAQLASFWELVFNQLEVIFQRYQPDTTADDLRGMISHHEALGILGFYDKYRFLQRKDEQEKTGSGKKKIPVSGS